MKNTRFPIIVFSLILLMAISCRQETKDDENKKVIAEWTGKEVIFPDSLCLADSSFFEPTYAGFTILVYFDSEGCTGCRMRLPYWKQFMHKADSICGNVRLVMIATSKDTGYISEFADKNEMSHNIVLDPGNRFQQFNNIPAQLRFQTFLLDRWNRVCVIGDPLGKRKVRKLYYSKITQGNIVLQDSGEKIHEIKLGSVGRGNTVTAFMKLRNNGNDTLRIKDVITGCECTSASLSSYKVAPGEQSEVTIDFHDTVPGEFYRTVTIEYFNRQSTTTIELSGIIK